MSQNEPEDKNTAQADMLASLGGIDLDVAILDDPATPSNHFQVGKTSSVEEKALALLGSGVAAEAVASALGVTPGRISQLLAEETFSQAVAGLRYDALQQHNKRDDRYDRLEDTLMDKLDKAMPLLVRPVDIMNALTKVNGATRRGQSAPTQVNNQQNIVTLVMPTIIVDKFTTNAQNQVTSAGDQDLSTMASGNLLKQVEDASAPAALPPVSPDT
tara:strand:+ start:18212 stop:18859 length:648 start_codon:yes stop_codon:yes gene_type:complete